MKQFRLSKDEEMAPVDVDQGTPPDKDQDASLVEQGTVLDEEQRVALDEEKEAPVESVVEIKSDDPLDILMADEDPSTDIFRISRIEEKPPVEEEQEELSSVSPVELLQKARRLEEVSSKVSCAEIMLKRGLITQDDLKKILKKQGDTKGFFHQIIADTSLVPRDKILQISAEEWGIMRYIDISKEDNIDPEIIKMIPESKARRSLSIPIYKNEKKLSVAMADPLDIFTADDIKISLRATGLEFDIEPLLAFPTDITKKLDEVYGIGDTIVQEILEGIQDEDDIQVEATDETEDEDLDIARAMELAQKGPIIGLVNAILVEAVKQGTSDIHIEPFRRRSVLRFRVDTRLTEIPSIPLPRSRHNAIISRIKIMAHCDIAERRRPQDGRIHIKAGGKEYDMRVSIVPSAFGESVVMRIAETSSTGYSLEELGFLPGNLDLFQHAIEQPYGLILVTGPTGSGKTTTLYSALNTINTPEIKILTVENPIERSLDGAIQVQTKPEIGLDFGEVLKYFLRHDPDVVMVGEIRDGETAAISVEAALTGHLVFSTLHTNDAASSIIRLHELGINEFLLASSAQLAQAQRLVRKICERCRQPTEATDSMLKELERRGVDVNNGIQLFKGAGCDSCNDTGHKGMTALHELLPIDNEIRHLILKGDFSAPQLQEIGREKGMRTLREDGMSKVAMGVTTFEEVIMKTMDSD